MNKFRLCRGFSFIEVLVVIAIIATIAAIVTPALTASKRQSFITRDVAKLHQCQVAIALYQHDNDGGGITEFNLPLPPDWLSKFNRQQTFYGTTSSDWASACGWHPNSPTSNFVMFASDNQTAKLQYAAHGARTILLSDENCNDTNVDVSSEYVTKLGLGVLTEGTLVRRIHQGNVNSFYFWEDVSK